MAGLGGLIEGVSRTQSESYKVWIAGCAVLLALLWGWIPPLRRRQALIALTLVAGLNYARWGTRVPFDRVDTYDLFHYYVNARWFDQLGYYDLYPAVMRVDHDTGGPRFPEPARYMAQDDSGHHWAPLAEGLARGTEVKKRFTDAEWRAFTHDVVVLQRELAGFSSDKELWTQMITDHGFNGTPAWVSVARPLARAVPVEAIKWLCWIDPVLLGAAIGLVGWAYGADAAIWTALFLFASYSARWPTISWSYLRYDWIAALIAATALLKKGRPLLAGLLTGWAGASRFFPATWLWGAGFRVPLAWWRKESARASLLILLGAALGFGALEAVAAIDLGPDAIRTHFENMEDHVKAEQLSSRRIGLSVGLAYDGQALPKMIDDERRAKVGRLQPLALGIGLAWIVATGLLLRHLRDDEAFGFGFVPFFLLTTASYYYYVARATLVVVHAGELDRWRNRLLLAFLFGIECFGNAAETWYPGYRLLLIGWTAWLLALYALLLTGFLAWEARSQRR
jgi:hypothetical protein